MDISALAPESLLLPPTAGFECGERIVDADEKKCDDYDEETTLPVSFICKLPSNWNGATNDKPQTFYFGCRRPSFGVLTGKEEKVDEEQFDASVVDPNFFDSGYTLAGCTGFCVWAGARFLVESFTMPKPSSDSFSRLKDYQSRIANGARVLELGAGVGSVGTILAAAGAEVLMTDLSTLVENAIQPNISRNAKQIMLPTTEELPPNWLQDAYAQKMGKGWAGSKALDWTVPLNKQLTLEERQSIDIIVASDCMWLPSIRDAN